MDFTTSCVHSANKSRLPRTRNMPWWMLAALVFLLVAGACRSPQAENPTSPSPALPPPDNRPGPPIAPDISSLPPREQQLVVWAPDFLEAGADDRERAILAAAYQRFEQAHNGVNLEVHIKAQFGTASMGNYLRSAQRVAPAILPDLVLLDTQQLWPLVDVGLIQPLDVANEVQIADFYQFTLDAVTYQGQVYGIPYLADVIHLVYDPNRVNPAPPTWEELLQRGPSYLMPLGGSDGYGNDSLLLQYVGAGGQLLENGGLSNPEALQAVLAFLHQAHSRGILPDTALTLADLDAVWTAFHAGAGAMAHVSAHTFLQDDGAGNGLGYAQVPTRQGLPATIARTWAFAILTNDPARRTLALALVQELLAPEVQGEWTALAHYLPSRRNSLEAWPDHGGYLDFLSRQLEVAVALPNGRAFAEFSRSIQSLQQAVLRGELTPEEALLQMEAAAEP
ncbi:MAG: maltose ABC transporter substrate-binding protein [Litorilinea sp.]|nr:MAG: maltose ABC transporter substrate-binding protein [Litorilinea sp.]